MHLLHLFREQPRIHKPQLAGRSPIHFHGGSARKPSLQNHHNNLGNFRINSGEKGQIASWGSPSPKDLGGAPASASTGFHTPLAWQNTALEEESGEEPKLAAFQHDQLTNLQEAVGNLVLLLDSFHKGDPSSFELDEKKRACREKLSKGAKQEDPYTACSSIACRQTTQQAKEQRQLTQERLPKGQLRNDLPQEAKKQTIGQTSLGANNLRGTSGFEANNLGTLGHKSIRTNSLEDEDQQQQCSGSLEQQPLASQRSSLQIWKILLDTGAELSVAPWDFAAEIQLHPLKQDLQLLSAKGEAIETYGVRTLQLLTPGFSFNMSFVIANVQQPLLGLGSLLRENLTLQLDNNLGHHLGNLAGEKIQLEQRGLQLYLSACPAKPELTPCNGGTLLSNSLVPETILGPHDDKQLGKSKRIQGGAVSDSFPLGSLEQHKPPKNKKAVGQQQKASPKAKQKQQGRKRASKLKLEKTNFMEKMQLALLENQDPRASLDHHTGKDLSLRVFLTLSLMKRWQLTTARVQTALPSNLATTQLRQLGLRESEVDSDILVGDELGVIQHGETWLIGGEKTKQESFLQDLSAIFTLTTTQQLEHNKPMIFQDKILELNQADRTISLYLPNAFYSNLVSRYSLEEEEATSTPTQKLDKRPPRSQSTSLDGQRSQLYKQTVEELLWSSNLRPDTSFAVNQLSQSFMHPTERDEEQLRSLLKYMHATQHLCVSLGVPRRWKKAKQLELLAFSTSWSEGCRSTTCACLSFMGMLCATSMITQATSKATAELASVRLATNLAFHTKSLLQDLQLAEPLSFRVLTRGPVTQKLGLSKKHRHIELSSQLGQFQLSKVQPQQNLAEQMTNTHEACALHRLLPKLEMHTRVAETTALLTVRGKERAFLSRSLGSFFIGVVSRAPAMKELCFQLGSAEELWGKELEKPNKIPQLGTALLYKTSLQPELERTALTAELDSTALTEESNLQQQELAAAYASELAIQDQSLQQKELTAAYAQDQLQCLDQWTRAWEDSFAHWACLATSFQATPSSTRACDLQLDASTSSPRASRKQSRALKSESSLAWFSSHCHLDDSQLVLI